MVLNLTYTYYQICPCSYSLAICSDKLVNYFCIFWIHIYFRRLYANEVTDISNSVAPLVNIIIVFLANYQRASCRMLVSEGNYVPRDLLGRFPEMPGILISWNRSVVVCARGRDVFSRISPQFGIPFTLWVVMFTVKSEGYVYNSWVKDNPCPLNNEIIGSSLGH